MVDPGKIKELSRKYSSRILEIRRHLHAHPELSFKEYSTSAYIQSQLKEAGISFKNGYVETGVVALIEGPGDAKKTVLLRADMDALPITEKNEVSYSSKNHGVMHACGHDVHSACALGAAFILNDLRREIKGNVKIMFQPGEELLPGGASLMIKAGVLEAPKVDKAIALHVFPSMETGKTGFRKGMYMASTDELYLTVNGKGGHAAMKGEYINPLIIASEILLEIEWTFMSAEGTEGNYAGTIPTVVAFGKIEGKGATNVIPEKVELAGTFRTMDETWRKKVHEILNEIVSRISAKHGVSSDLRIDHGYPVLFNDEKFTAACIKDAEVFLGKENVEELPLRMTAEDFAFVSQAVPSCFFRLGTGNRSKGIISGVHTPTFDIDERALETGAGMMAWLALNALEND
jgi:amidohydrolase